MQQFLVNKTGGVWHGILSAKLGMLRLEPYESLPVNVERDWDADAFNSIRMNPTIIGLFEAVPKSIQAKREAYLASIGDAPTESVKTNSEEEQKKFEEQKKLEEQEKLEEAQKAKELLINNISDLEKDIEIENQALSELNKVLLAKEEFCKNIEDEISKADKTQAKTLKETLKEEHNAIKQINSDIKEKEELLKNAHLLLDKLKTELETN